jgi:L-ribulose-5-phosphate 3-epimerase
MNPDELGQDPATGMDLAVSLGISHLEIRTAFGSNVVTLHDEQVQRIRRLAEERNLRVLSLASPLWKWCDPSAAPRRIDSFNFPTRVPEEDRAGWVDRALAVAEVLGTRIVRVFSHLCVDDGFTESFSDDPLLSYALERAKDIGVRLLLENEPVCTVSEPEPLLNVLRRHKGLGLWLDLGNLYEVGHGTVAAVAALAPYVGYVHVKDFRRPGVNGRKDYVPAGTGEVPYEALIPALHSIRPQLPYALETHVRDQPGTALAEGASYLRSAVPGGLA